MTQDRFRQEMPIPTRLQEELPGRNMNNLQPTEIVWRLFYVNGSVQHRPW